VTVVLVLLNLAAIAYAIYEGGPGRWDYHFRKASLVTWFASAQMFGAALVFLACYFAGTIIQLEGEERRANHTWLVFALGFFVLAVDQQFWLREHLTAWIERAQPAAEGAPATVTATALKVIAATVAVALVIYYRSTVLANFRMVVAFIGGFWFLLMMLIVHMLIESVGLPAWLGKILEGSGKLLAMSMFLGGSYIALLDRLSAANALAQLALYGDRRRRQIPISFPDRRGKVEFRPVEGEVARAADESAPDLASEVSESDAGQQEAEALEASEAEASEAPAVAAPLTAAAVSAAPSTASVATTTTQEPVTTAPAAPAQTTASAQRSAAAPPAQASAAAQTSTPAQRSAPAAAPAEASNGTSAAPAQTSAATPAAPAQTSTATPAAPAQTTTATSAVTTPAPAAGAPAPASTPAPAGPEATSLEKPGSEGQSK